MNERLNLQDLIDLLAKKQGITKKDAENFLRELFAVISENIENSESVKIKDFGTFKLIKVSARKSVNVNTGEDIEIPAHYKLSFTPDKTLKEAINKPFAHFESVPVEDGITFDDMDKLEDTTDEEHEEIESSSVEVDDIPAITKTIIEEENIDTEPEGIEKEIINPDPEDGIDVISDLLHEEEEKVLDIDYSEKIPQPTAFTSSSVSVSEENFYEKRDDKKRKRKYISLGFFIFIILAAFAICGYYFQEIAQYLTDGKYDKDSRNVIVYEKDSLAVSKPVSDSLVATGAVKDSISSEKNVQQQEDITTPLTVETIRAGHTLRNISLKYYGHKSFWVYIYEENRNAIKNPNNVPLGTKLVIPSPAKYGIDANNKESVEKAKKAESELITKLGL